MRDPYSELGGRAKVYRPFQLLRTAIFASLFAFVWLGGLDRAPRHGLGLNKSHNRRKSNGERGREKGLADTTGKWGERKREKKTGEDEDSLMNLKPELTEKLREAMVKKVEFIWEHRDGGGDFKIQADKPESITSQWKENQIKQEKREGLPSPFVTAKGGSEISDSSQSLGEVFLEKSESKSLTELEREYYEQEQDDENQGTKTDKGANRQDSTQGPRQKPPNLTDSIPPSFGSPKRTQRELETLQTAEQSTKRKAGNGGRAVGSEEDGDEEGLTRGTDTELSTSKSDAENVIRDKPDEHVLRKLDETILERTGYDEEDNGKGVLEEMRKIREQLFELELKVRSENVREAQNQLKASREEGFSIGAEYRWMTETMAGRPSLMGHVDGSARVALFRYPAAVALDREGSVYVADKWNHVIRRISPDLEVTTVAGNGELGSSDGFAQKASFSFPSAIDCDKEGNLFISDGIHETHQIRKLSYLGYVTTLPKPTQEILEASRKDLFAGIAGTGAVAGEPKRKIGRGRGKARLREGGKRGSEAEKGVETETNGNIKKDLIYFREDCDTHGLRASEKAINGLDTGEFHTSGYSYNSKPNPNPNLKPNLIPAPSPLPLRGIALSRWYGDIYSASADTPAIIEISPLLKNKVYIVAGKGFQKVAENDPRSIGGAEGDGSLDGNGRSSYHDGLAQSATLGSPAGVVFDDNTDTLFVADIARHTIRKIEIGESWFEGKLDTIVTTYAGDMYRRIPRNLGKFKNTRAAVASLLGNRDGMRSSARFLGPVGLALDFQQNLYVSERYGKSIRKISPSGKVFTLAGQAAYEEANSYQDGPASATRFGNLGGISVNPTGTRVFVADSGNHCIRCLRAVNMTVG
eukprot:CAMPEP_0184504566 /NCGR_PEP_ID=MMETSP0113_2-20130426/52533_1 /TAXON_ID=91329 /ORGANISM="Norrisiella sphaerica, Strain BC52" /LENGTH=867 /DNA_ID=CAMNT_0026894217 /DNA_START=118 /DNA_END=2717 /DNA_ORIENTATION=+